MTGIAIVVTMPAPGYGGTYKISQSSNGAWIVTGPALPSNLFVKGATAALETALPHERDTLQSVTPAPAGGMEAIFAPAGMPGATASTSSQVESNFSSKLVIVMPIKVDNGTDRQWARTGKWARTWFVPSIVNGYTILEVPADSQDQKRFAGLLNDLSGLRASAIAQSTMNKYGAGSLVITLYNRGSSTVKTWFWTQNNLSENTETGKTTSSQMLEPTVQKPPTGYGITANGFAYIAPGSTGNDVSSSTAVAVTPQTEQEKAIVNTSSADSSANAYQTAIQNIKSQISKISKH